MSDNKKQLKHKAKQITDDYFKDETKCHLVERIATSLASPAQKYKMIKDLTRCIEQAVLFTLQEASKSHDS